ncbi:unnamed protein product [Pedinophyceae sp. YPF-701]|nr:unnamed protein product [Pedinophyceae sp. YPF-701]
MGKLREMLSHPDEIVPLFRMYLAARRAKQLPKDPNWAFCYEMLNRVSRSFAVVIQELPQPLRDAVCIFYLVLRALDTVEDDMKIPADEKLPLLREFYAHTSDPEFRVPGAGVKPHELLLMDEYPKVVACFNDMDREFQMVIRDITKRMGAGMAEFVERDERDERVVSIQDWDLYCHYVAGLVGVGLSKLFSSSGLEARVYGSKQFEALSNDMGLFLQKTNIIRDYLEDINEEPKPRMFWPEDVWRQYAKKLEDFKTADENAVMCLNELINSALGHVPKCFEYMAGLRNQRVFRFCAIPQIMAIGTLALCYNNNEVFKGVVKLRRGRTAKLVGECNGMSDLYRVFYEFAGEIGAKCQGFGAQPDSKVQAATIRIVEDIRARCRKGLAAAPGGADAKLGDAEQPPPELWVRLGLVLMFGGYFAYAWQLGVLRAYLGVAADAGNFYVDSMQKIVSLGLFIMALFLAVTGRRL